VFLEPNSTVPALSEPFEWHGYRDPTLHRWEQDRYLGEHDSRLVVARPDQSRTYAGFVAWWAIVASGPVACYRTGILLLPEHRGQRLGSAAQRLVPDYLPLGKERPSCRSSAASESLGTRAPVFGRTSLGYADDVDRFTIDHFARMSTTSPSDTGDRTVLQAEKIFDRDL
jgi:hypothetical protein